MFKLSFAGNTGIQMAAARTCYNFFFVTYYSSSYIRDIGECTLYGIECLWLPGKKKRAGQRGR